MPACRRVSIEGPLGTAYGWGKFYRLFSFARPHLLRSLQRCLFRLGPEGLKQATVFTYRLLDVEYHFRISKVEIIGIPENQPNEVGSSCSLGIVLGEISAPTIGSSEPSFPSPEEAGRGGSGYLVHGVGQDWRPADFPAVPGLNLFPLDALDLVLAQPSSPAWERVIHNLSVSSQIGFIFHGIDHVPNAPLTEALTGVLGLLGRRGIRYWVVCESIGNVNVKIMDLIDKRNYICLTRPAPLVLAHPSPVAAPPALADQRLEVLFKQSMYDAFVVPIVHTALIARFPCLSGSSPKLLLHGPSGSGKSTLANMAIDRLRAESGLDYTVVEMNANSLFSKYLGGTEKRILKRFKKAKVLAPSVLLIEGLHALAPSRQAQDGGDDDHGEYGGVQDTYSRVLATLLMCLDGIDSHGDAPCPPVIATSLVPPDRLDPAIIRPGRIETWVDLND